LYFTGTESLVYCIELGVWSMRCCPASREP
jgi:hypothetical protein